MTILDYITDEKDRESYLKALHIGVGLYAETYPFDVMGFASELGIAIYELDEPSAANPCAYMGMLYPYIGDDNESAHFGISVQSKYNNQQKRFIVAYLLGWFCLDLYRSQLSEESKVPQDDIDEVVRFMAEHGGIDHKAIAALSLGWITTPNYQSSKPHGYMLNLALDNIDSKFVNFAVELLMPEHLFRKQWDLNSRNVPDYFQVSEAAAITRAIKLNLMLPNAGYFL